jgi:cholesterol oxidase
LADVTPADVPEDRAMLLMSTQRRERSGNGVRFQETMTGWIKTGGRTRATRLSLDAHIAGWQPFLRDPSHPIAISGTIDIEGIATARPVTGTLELFPNAGDVAMRYCVNTSENDGDPLVLIGTKRQHRLSPFHLWSDLTTLDIETHDTVGRLHITPVGTLKLGTSIRGDAFTRGKRARAVARFLMYFTRGVVQGTLAP